MREFIYARLQGFYPVYLPQDSVLSKNVIFPEQKRSLHGGVPMTISHVRSLFWIPHLRCLSKSVIRNCYGCKKVYHTITARKVSKYGPEKTPYLDAFHAVHSPKPRPLPKDRTKKCFSFEVIGTDYAGPIYSKTKKKSELKAYLTIFLLRN